MKMMNPEHRFWASRDAGSTDSHMEPRRLVEMAVMGAAHYRVWKRKAHATLVVKRSGV